MYSKVNHNNIHIKWADESDERKKFYIFATVCIILTCSIIGIAIGYAKIAESGISTSNSTDTSKYGFETKIMGWKRQTWQDSQAITAVALTNSTAKFGSACLQCTVDLVGGDENKSAGEAYVEDMRKPAARPTNTVVPVDLSNSTVSVWVYIPAEAAGNESMPNGIQLLFKSETNSLGDNWPSAYSTWYNIGSDITTDEWFPIEINIPFEAWAWPAPENVAHLPDFTKIIQVGVKIGVGCKDFGLPTETWSTATFNGAIYIDAVDWRVLT